MAADGLDMFPETGVDSAIPAEVSVVAEQGDTTRSADGPGPVLLVISNQDFWYQDYSDTRVSLDTAGSEVVVANDGRTGNGGDTTRSESKPKPVLMVIANQDFYHREYFETRATFEAAGLELVVAAATTETATPHAISVVEGREPDIDPDLALSDVNAQDYSRIVFIGGYGAASYQYAYEVTYENVPPATDQAIMDLVG